MLQSNCEPSKTKRAAREYKQITYKEVSTRLAVDFMAQILEASKNGMVCSKCSKKRTGKYEYCTHQSCPSETKGGKNFPK
jgi:hypothetical protein